MTFREMLIEIRTGYELSQKDMAARLDITPQYLCDLEHGRRLGSVEVVERICMQWMEYNQGVSKQTVRNHYNQCERERLARLGPTKALAAPEAAGDTWTWTAIDADSKLIVGWLVGGRDAEYANAFVSDLASRLSAGPRSLLSGLYLICFG